MISNFGLILLCLALGVVFRRNRSLPDSAAAAFNFFILTVSVPALALLSLHEIPLGLELAFPIGMAWALLLLCWAFFAALGYHFRWKRETVGALVLTAGLGNTSFVGYPLLTTLYGPHALRTGVLVDQAGSFLALSSLGILIATMYSSRRASLTASLYALPRKLLTFPPFIAVIAALVLRPWTYPDGFDDLLRKLAAPLAPLALVSVGLQLGKGFTGLKKHLTELSLGLLFKLVLGPALIYFIYVVVLGAQGEEIQITIAQAAMAPMITAAVLATDHDLQAELSNLMLSIGIPLSLITVPIWAYLLRTI